MANQAFIRAARACPDQPIRRVASVCRRSVTSESAYHSPISPSGRLHLRSDQAVRRPLRLPCATHLPKLQWNPDVVRAAARPRIPLITDRWTRARRRDCAGMSSNPGWLHAGPGWVLATHCRACFAVAAYAATTCPRLTGSKGFQ
jgi:hypothetical protein